MKALGTTRAYGLPTAEGRPVRSAGAFPLIASVGVGTRVTGIGQKCGPPQELLRLACRRRCRPGRALCRTIARRGHRIEDGTTRFGPLLCRARVCTAHARVFGKCRPRSQRGNEQGRMSFTAVALFFPFSFLVLE